MINLLPPSLKEEIRYAKLNRIVLGYVKVTVLVVIVLVVIFGGAFYYLNLEASAALSNVTSKEQTISQYKGTILPKATDASSRLSAISYVQNTQTHFSKVISDIAQVIPQGVSLDTISFDGSSATPVSITVSTQTYDEVLELRNALLTSPRIAACDIDSITALSPAQYGYSFSGSLVFAFKPGEAK